jgi:hypothetical protein
MADSFMYYNEEWNKDITDSNTNLPGMERGIESPFTGEK